MDDQDLRHGSSVLLVGSVDECEQICRLSVGCDGWTFDNRGGDVGDRVDRNRCFLKFEVESFCERDLGGCLLEVQDNSVVSGFSESGNRFNGYVISNEFDASCCQ